MVLLGTTISGIADQPCQLKQYTSIDLGTDIAGGVYVPATIDGHAENLLVDTGGIVSMLTETTVHDLSLTRGHLSCCMFVYMLGARLTELAHADTVQLGNMKAGRTVFLVMPDGGMPSDEAGTLAPDFMGNYDVELDFAKGKFNLFSPEHCPGQVVYWTHEAYAQIPIEIERMGHISVQVQLEGKTMQAWLDTGSSRSLLAFESARDLYGWDEKTADLKVTAHRNDGSPSVYHYPFKSLSFSGVSVSNPDIALISSQGLGDRGLPKSQLILGMDSLRQLHLYIAYKEKAIYVTAAGAH